MNYEFPKGNFVFDNVKLTIEGTEKKEYSLTETGIYEYSYMH